MNLEDKKIVLDDSTEYLVVEHVSFEGRNYVYLINKNNPTDCIYSEIINDGTVKLVDIDRELFKTKILPLFIEKIKQENI